MASGRRPRPRQVALDHQQLVDAWTPLAKDRSCQFKWDGSLYTKPSRNLNGDQESLMLHLEPLKVLLALAPTGFPAHRQVQKALQQLQQDFNILNCKEQELNIITADAADCWRIMCKHVYTMKKNKIKVKGSLQELLDLVGAECQGETSEPATSSMEEPLSIEETRRMFDDFEEHDRPDIEVDDDVMVTKVTCQCLDCCMQVASAKRGGQRKETKPKEGNQLSKVKIVNRKASKKQSSGTYLMVNGKFCIALSSNQTADYRSFLAGMAKKIELGEVTTVSEAKAAIAADLHG